MLATVASARWARGAIALLPPRAAAGYAANNTIFDRRPDLDAASYAEIVATWVDAGVTIIGGCCDMYPEDIAELSARFG